MKFLFLAGLGQSLGQVEPVVEPKEYWTRGTDDNSYSFRHRGPLGANTLPDLAAGEKWSEMGSWDYGHNFDSTTSYSYNLWPWLSSGFSLAGDAARASDFYIMTYRYGGIEGLDSLNSAVVQNLPAYNKLYAWMHRISNAKLNGLEEGTEWWLYDSCDGPTCGQDRMADRTTTTVATTTAANNSTVFVSSACFEAQKALSAEENSLAKIPLQLACETACTGVAGALCEPSCFEAQKALSAEENSAAKIPLILECESACADVTGAICDTVSAACREAQKALSAEENSLNKIPLQFECESACANDPEATCGFLVNGLSMLLIAVLAMLK